jgi:hypothetical protein
VSIPMFPTYCLRATWTATQPVDIVSVFEAAEHVSGGDIVRPDENTLHHVVELLDKDNDPESGNGPSQYAFHKVYRLVEATERLHRPVYVGSPSYDSDGGIRVTWRQGDREVRLVCPPQEKDTLYVYTESSEGHRVIDRGINPGFLAQRLNWLSARDTRVPTAK